MSDFVDTNVVVRYLTALPAEQAARVRALVDGGDPLLVTSVALLETYFVLKNDYGIERETILDHLTDFVLRSNIVTADADKSHIVEAFDLCRGSGRVSCGDALIWASVRSRTGPRGTARIYSLDRRFPQDGIDLLQP